MCCLQGQEDLCESFFKYNRGMGGLYDGTTRLYMSTSGTRSPITKTASNIYNVQAYATCCVAKVGHYAFSLPTVVVII